MTKVIATIDKSIVCQNTPEAQEYRIAQIPGKKILWVTCYYTAEFYEALKPLIQNLKYQHGADLYLLLNYKSAGDIEMANWCLKDGIIDNLSKNVIFADFQDAIHLTNNLMAAIETKYKIGNTIDREFMEQSLGDVAFKKTVSDEKMRSLHYYNSKQFNIEAEIARIEKSLGDKIDEMIAATGAEEIPPSDMSKISPIVNYGTIGEDEKEEITFDAVFSPHEVSQPTVSELAKCLSLPGNEPMAYYNARNKFMAREKLSSLGVTQCKYLKVHCESDLVDIENKVGFPLVLKPVAGAASEGVYKCYNTEEIVTYMRKIFTSIDNNNMTLIYNPGTSNNACGSDSSSPTSIPAEEQEVGGRAGIHFILEQYIAGDEFDVDVLMYDSEVVFVGAIDNWETHEPFFLETGSNCPSKYSNEKLSILKQYAVDCVLGLGFTQGCYHVEIKYTDKEPILIEVNSRMGGGRTRLMYEAVYGVDLFLNFFMSAIGIPIKPVVAPEPKCCLLDYFVCCPITGKLMQNDFLNVVKEHPNVINTSLYCKIGDIVKGYDRGIPQWIGDFQIKAPTYTKAMGIFHELIANVKPENSILAESEQERAKAARTKQRARKSSISENTRVSFSRADVLP